MPTDIELGAMCQALYDGQNIFDYAGEIEEISFAYKCLEDCNIIVFEGSHDFEDWKDDFDANMIRSSFLNGAGIHQGFYTGLEAVFAHVEATFSKTKPVYVTGHSLGAGRASIFAAMLIVEGYNVVVVNFGSPRPGDEKLSEILAPFPVRSYWNYLDEFDHDVVGDVPIAFSPLFRFVIVRERIKIVVRPAENDPWGKFMGWHHMSYYLKGISNG